MTWMIENGGTLLLGVLLLTMVTAILWRMRRNRKQGKSSCGCGCSHCPMNGSCHPK